MASVYPITTRTGVVRYKAEVRLAGMPIVRDIFDTREEAQAWADKAEADARAEREMRRNPQSSLPASGELKDEMLLTTLQMFIGVKATHAHKQITPVMMKMIPRVGGIVDVKLSQLNEAWIEDYIALLRRTKTYRDTFYSYSSILKQMTIIKMAMKWRARRLGLVVAPMFPFSTGEMFPEDWENERDRRPEQAEEHQLRQLMRTLPDIQSYFWRLLMMFAKQTGARQSEMVEARWGEFTNRGEYWFWTIPKEHNKSNRARVVPLNVDAVRVLKFLKRLASPGEARLFHGFKDAAYVSKTFHDYVVECGIKDLRFHDWRHHGISLFVLRERNFTVDEVMRIVGHRSREMLDRYTNLRGDELAAKLMRRQPSIANAARAMVEKMFDEFASGNFPKDLPTPAPTHSMPAAQGTPIWKVSTLIMNSHTPTSTPA